MPIVIAFFGLTLIRQVHSELACIPVTGCMQPGVASVQAAESNPEIGMIVVDEDNLPTRGENKPTQWMKRKAAVLSCHRASE